MKNKNKKYKAIKLLVHFFSKHKLTLFISIITGALVIAINVTQAYLIQELIDEAINIEFSSIWSILLLFIGITIIGIGVSYFSKLSNGIFVNRVVKDMRAKLAKHVGKMSFKGLSDGQSGDMVSRLNNDIDQINQFVGGVLSEFISEILLAVVAGIVIFIIDYRLLLAGLIITPFCMAASYFVNKNTQKYYPECFNQLGKATAEVEQTIIGIDTVKSYNLFKYFHKKVDLKYKNVFKAEMKAQRYISMIQPICFILAFAPRIIGVMYSGYLASINQLTIGSIVLTMILFEWIAIPTVGAPFFMNGFNRMIAATERVMEVLDMQLERSSGRDFIGLCNDSAIKFKNVDFNYKESEKVLKNLSFSIKSSGITALVGRSGSGKSTIADIITCLYEYEKGSIELFGEELKELSPESVRKQITVVSQDTYLYPETVLENIRYGRQDVEEEEVIAAAKAVSAHEFIQELPKGYETLIGDGGSGLSGGQQQRISLARALIKESNIVIFDEPTASLDYHTEKVVHETLMKLAESKTVLVITHRLSTLSEVDQIIVLDKGEIVQEGTLDELLEDKGKFYEIFKAELSA